MSQAPSLSSVGWTPLYHAERLGRQLGLSQLYIKDDGRNPTGSTKDRASAVVVAKALELGEPTVATASSGNAAAALAGLGAAAGLRTVIFVPQSAPEAKVAQLLIYGATVLLVEGSYDDAFELCLAACKEWGWYCRNTGYNPHTAEGKKTCALEIAEQLGWDAPDTILVAVGDGNIIAGLHRGFQDALALGWIVRMPRLIGVQAAAAAALERAWHAGAADVIPERAETLADSINVGLPRDGFRALRAVRASGGMYLAVEDEAILHALGVLARSTGIFTEPAGAAPFAALFALAERGEIRPDERVVVVNTGNGLKDIRAAARAAHAPYRVAPSLDAVRLALGAWDVGLGTGA
jgi:threonine synthase